MEQQNLTNAIEIILQMRREIEAERRAHEDTIQALERKLKEFTTAL